ncbi:MAG: LexA family transcriptional regulator [Gemmatimonadaceae bacterium]|nr:LexA family transcriptional regulator [Gloeobacterales cyanobacterium ES-bin-141]
MKEREATVVAVSTIAHGQGHAFPLFGARPAAGFPSPADNFLEDEVALDDLVEHPAATFLVRVSGLSMAPTVWDRDLLLVDRALEPKDGDVLVVALGGELVVKRLQLALGCAQLVSDNSAYPAVKLDDGAEAVCWGVAIYAIRPLR